MKSKNKRRFSDEEIIQFLDQVVASDGATNDLLLDKLARECGFSKKEFEQWRGQYGNKFSVNACSRRLDLSEPYLPVKRLADRQHLPLESVLHFASQGLIPIFTFFHQHDATFLSVHRDFIVPQGLTLPESVSSLPNPPRIGASHTCSQGISGFFLNAQDCSELLKNGKVRQGLFPSALRKHFDHYSAWCATPGYFPHDRYPSIDPEGWGVACYPKETVLDFDSEKGFPLPTILDIGLASLYVLKEDIEAFFNVVDTETFLYDLLVQPPGNPSNGDWRTSYVIYDKPPYISAKLTHLIETSEKFWCNKSSDDSGNYSSQKAKVRQALKDTNFLSSFKMAKGKVSQGVLEAAARFIEPLYVRHISNEGKRSGHAYLSPELLILLAAAKLFWSPLHIELGNPATHPKNDEIEAYLRIRGISGNDADYAITLIRPELATYGSHKATSRVWERHIGRLPKPTFPLLRKDS